ncbi:CRISPR-associated endoribonuclease Cas6 [Candidatus Dependentiae bacterium]|nr:CRISPR-associated endoribonuclease Cas6 [Candidatus Dependentiae bacterium]
MLLFLKIIPQRDTPQPLNPFFMQSFLYRIFINDQEYKKIHEKFNFKYFCFSNIYPFEKNKPLKKEKEYFWQISSPDKKLINYIKKNLKEKKNIKLGKSIFDLKEITIKKRPDRFSIVSTITPIVVSIPDKIIKTNNIIKDTGKVLYWNKKMPLNIFIEALNRNCIKKYNQFFNTGYNLELNLFNTYKFKRGALVDYIKKGQKARIPGSVWEFIVSNNNPEYKIIKFCLDTGFGEKNSAGFGFVNVKK